MVDRRLVHTAFWVALAMLAAGMLAWPASSQALAQAQASFLGDLTGPLNDQLARQSGAPP